jgi:probable phosphoglycerate mutase
VAGHEFALVLTSPLLRSRQTCEIAGFGGAEECDDLREWDYGDYEGLRSVDILQRRPDWNLFQHGCPGGESPAQVSDRADRVIARLRLLRGNIALCSHGHFGRTLAARWIGLPVGQAQHLLLNTASLSVLGHEHNRADQPVIALWNAASDDLLVPAPAARIGDTGTLKQRAIQRWENEGGEIPNERRGQSRT